MYVCIKMKCFQSIYVKTQIGFLLEILYCKIYQFVLIAFRQPSQYGLLPNFFFFFFQVTIMGTHLKGSPTDDLSSCPPLIPLSRFLSSFHNTRFFLVSGFIFILSQFTDVTWKKALQCMSMREWAGHRSLGLSQCSLQGSVIYIHKNGIGKEERC